VAVFAFCFLIYPLPFAFSNLSDGRHVNEIRFKGKSKGKEQKAKKQETRSILPVGLPVGVAHG
jgi:hypothetical protein